jgi:hypothetical protein
MVQLKIGKEVIPSQLLKSCSFNCRRRCMGDKNYRRMFKKSMMEIYPCRTTHVQQHRSDEQNRRTIPTQWSLHGCSAKRLPGPSVQAVCTIPKRLYPGYQSLARIHREPYFYSTGLAGFELDAVSLVRYLGNNSIFLDMHNARLIRLT